MAKRESTGRVARGSAAIASVGFSAVLCRPAPSANAGKPHAWTFLNLPPEASTKLPSRGMVSVSGTINRVPFKATLQPDGKGGHWLKVDRKLRTACGAQVGDVVELEFIPTSPGDEPEPAVPPDLRKALAAAVPDARKAWKNITPAARRDFIFWIVSPKKPETRARRVETACDMLAKGKRRPCCFDRSGMYDKSLSCPIADNASASRAMRRAGTA